MKIEFKIEINNDFILGLIQYPIYLIGSGIINSFVDLIITPIYLVYMRSKGVVVFNEIEPEWSFKQCMEYMKQQNKRTRRR